MNNNQIKFHATIDLAKQDKFGVINPNYRTITLEDVSNYTDPLSELIGYFEVKDPLGGFVHKGDFSSPDILMDTNRSFVINDFPLDAYGNPVNGEYKFKLYIQRDVGGAKTEYSSGEYKVKVCADGCNQSAKPNISLSFDCNIAVAKGVDNTQYRSGTTGDRVLTLVPPVGSKYLDGSDAVPMEVEQAIIQSSSLWTGTWQLMLRSVITEVGSNDKFSWKIKTFITDTKSSEATCSINICGLYSCVDKKYKELDSKASRRGGIANNIELADSFIEITSLLNKFNLARECGKVAQASKLYHAIKEVLGCDCDCSDSSYPTLVYPLVNAPNNNNVIVQQGDYVSVHSTVVGNTTTYTVAISTQLNNLISLIRTYDAESSDGSIKIQKSENGSSVVFDLTVDTDVIDHTLGSLVDASCFTQETELTGIVQALVDKECQGLLPPVANPDIVITKQGEPVSCLVTANDFFTSDVTVTITSQPLNGTAVVEADGKTITYTPSTVSGDNYVNVPLNFTTSSGHILFQESGLIPNGKIFETVGGVQILVSLSIEIINPNGTTVTETSSIIVASGFNFSQFTTVVQGIFNTVKSALPPNTISFNVGTYTMPSFSILGSDNDNYNFQLSVSSSANFITNPDNIINKNFSGNSFRLSNSYTSDSWEYNGLYRSKFGLQYTKADNTTNVIEFYNMSYGKVVLPNDVVKVERVIGEAPFNYVSGEVLAPPLEIHNEDVSFVGNDVLTYEITDQSGNSDSSTLSITVDPPTGASCKYISAQFVAGLSIQSGNLQLTLTNITQYLTNIPSSNNYVIEVRDSGNNTINAYNVVGRNDSLGQIYVIPDTPLVTWDNIMITQTVTSEDEVGDSCGSTIATNSYTMPNITSSAFTGVAVSCLGVSNSDPDTTILQAIVDGVCNPNITADNGLEMDGNEVILGGELKKNTGIVGNYSLSMEVRSLGNEASADKNSYAALVGKNRRYVEPGDDFNAVGATGQMFVRFFEDTDLDNMGHPFFAGHLSQLEVVANNDGDDNTRAHIEQSKSKHIGSPGIVGHLITARVNAETGKCKIDRVTGEYISGISKPLNSDVEVETFIQHYLAKQDQDGGGGRTVLAVERYGYYQEGSGTVNYFGGDILMNGLKNKSSLATDVDGVIIDGASDERLKENIQDLQVGLDEVLKLRAVEYNFKKETKRGSENRIGFIAQEVREVVPELIEGAETETEYLNVKYQEAVPLLVKAIQELSAKVDSLQNEINELKS